MHIDKAIEQIKGGYHRRIYVEKITREREVGKSKNHRVWVNSFQEGTSAKILGNIAQLVKSGPDTLIFYITTNDMTNRINLLNQAKEKSSASQKKQNTKILNLYFRGL